MGLHVYEWDEWGQSIAANDFFCFIRSVRGFSIDKSKASGSDFNMGKIPWVPPRIYGAVRRKNKLLTGENRRFTIRRNPPFRSVPNLS
jgi:hypothetical protein